MSDCERMFNQLVIISHTVRGIGGIVQNDPRRLYDDGYISLDCIKGSKEDMREAIEDVVNQLYSVMLEHSSYIDALVREIEGNE